MDAPRPRLVNLLDLAVAALASSIAASRPIRKLAEQAVGDISEKNTRIKLDGSIVTDADGAAQQIIVGALKEVSAHIRIVGEESSWEMDNSHARRLNFYAEDDAEEMELEERVFALAQDEVLRRHADNYPSSTVPPFGGAAEEDVPPLDGVIGDGDTAEKPAASALNESVEYGGDYRAVLAVDASRVSVFVDPLDGTSCYAKGEYDAVTILVAIVLDNIPVFGVICKPFGHQEGKSVLDTGCFAVYGGTLIGGAYIAGGGECDRSAAARRRRQPRIVQDGSEGPAPTNDDDDAMRRAIISRSRAVGVVRKCIDALADRDLLHPEPVLVSGAGAKTLCLICGEMNEALWFFPKPGTSLWDVAAADALLRAIGGRLSDKDDRVLDYSRSRHDAENYDGIVACSDAALHAECIRLFRSEGWSDDDS